MQNPKGACLNRWQLATRSKSTTETQERGREIGPTSAIKALERYY